MTPITRRQFLTTSAIVAAGAGMGCHTANGFGQDMTDAGNGIQNGTK